MSRFYPSKHQPTGVLIGLALLSCLFGLMLSTIPQIPEVAFAQQTLAQEINRTDETLVFPPHTTTDRVPESLETGQSLYVQNCGSCHIAIPPAVFPSQTWDQLIRDPSHYGMVIEPLPQPQQSWVRRYLLFASRLLRPEESTPYRFRQSRYFKILHYQVELPSTINSSTCVTCHPKAPSFNFRESA